MRLLVTGGCGFIGSNFIRHILENPDYEIINLDKLTYAGNLDNLKDIETNRYRFVKGDICDAQTVEPLIKEVDAIVHFAAETHVDRSITNPSDFIRTNVLGTQVLLNAAKKYKRRFHHISTDEVYGELGFDDKPFDENTPYNPRSPYSASKAASDHLVRAYHNTYDLPITISHCSNNYGPYQHPEKLMPLFITNLIQKKTVPVYGEGKNIRDWLHVKDHCKAIQLILEKGTIGETYCIGGGCEKTNLEITKFILGQMGETENMIEFVEDRPGHDLRYAISFNKIQKDLGWKPKLDFEQGLKHKINWYKENDWWWKPLKSQ
ncbi:MAG: dTDP-glucose 4,6-dehydratase [Nanoarchaeota archaeon]|nr:dTDP-glucose 4,6-dehydratase [Nanoarchaeota archaeon]